jgi:hypothetical protein
MDPHPIGIVLTYMNTVSYLAFAGGPKLALSADYNLPMNSGSTVADGASLRPLTPVKMN